MNKMKKNLTYLSLKYRKFSLFMVLIVLILGSFNYFIMPRQEVADVSPPLAQLITIYPGGSPEDIENLITDKIETEVSKIKGFDESSSISKSGISIVKVFLDDEAIPEESWLELNETIDDLEGEMPQGTLSIQVNTDLANTAGIIISLSGEGYDYEVLADYADYIEEELLTIDGIESFDVLGNLSKEVEIIIDYKKLNNTFLSIEAVSNRIKAENIKIPAGNLENGLNKIKVNTSGSFKNLDSIKNMILGVSDDENQVIRLKDIASVKYNYDEETTHYSYNGNKSILLTGYFKEDLNIVTVGKNVENKLAELKINLPKDLEVNKVSFQPGEIEKSINEFIINLLQAVLFVVLVVLIGMGFRNAIIVSTTIPFSIAVTFIAMNFLGIKLEQMSITALIIALGMLVDNAIVVSDSIQHYLDQGVKPFKASVNGANDVAFAMLTSTLTTIIAFSPLLFIKSAIGDYLFGIPSVVIIALLASYLCAQLITPLMAYLFLKPSNGKTLKIFAFKKYFVKGFNWSINHKKVLITIIILSLISTGVMFKTIQKSMFPKANKSIFYINLTSEESGNIKATENLVKEIEEILINDFPVNEVTSSFGDGLPKFYMTVLPVTPAKETGQILAKIDMDKLGENQNLKTLTESIQERLNEEISGGIVSVRLLDMGTSSDKAISFQIAGNNLDIVKEISDEVTNKLSEIEGTTQTSNSFFDKVYELKVNVNKDKASIYKLTSMDIQKMVSNSLKGIKSTSFEDGNKTYDILIKSNINTKKDLENLMIKSSLTGKKILLKSIASIDLIKVYPQIEHLDGKRVVKIDSDIKDGFNSKLIEDEIKEFIESKNYKNIFVTYEGEMSRVKDSFLDLGKYALISLLFIFALLILQFNSYIQPIIIFISIILSFVGGISGLYFSGQPLSFTALLGLVSLMGIVVNNAIVLVDYMNQNKKEDQSILSICEEAIDRRFRPIILSTTTTIVGLTPLLLTSGELFRPLATVIISGLIISTTLTLIVVPTIYYKFQII